MKITVMLELAPPFRLKPVMERMPLGRTRFIWAWFSLTVFAGMNVGDVFRTYTVVPAKKEGA